MSNFVNRYTSALKSSISMIEIVTYTVSVLIIIVSIIKAIYIYIHESSNFEQAFIDTRSILGDAVSLALSFILCVEVLKFFYIKTYHQLVIVVVLTLLKLIIEFYLENQMPSEPTQTNNTNNN